MGVPTFEFDKTYSTIHVCLSRHPFVGDKNKSFRTPFTLIVTYGHVHSILCCMQTLYVVQLETDLRFRKWGCYEIIVLGMMNSLYFIL